MYVVMNKLTVAPEGAAGLESGFAHSGERMRQTPGCVNFELLREEETESKRLYMVITQWQDKDAFLAWTQSEAFQRAHAGAGDSGAMGQLYVVHLGKRLIPPPSAVSSCRADNAHTYASRRHHEYFIPLLIVRLRSPRILIGMMRVRER